MPARFAPRLLVAALLCALTVLSGCDTNDPAPRDPSAEITSCPTDLGVDEAGVFEAEADYGGSSNRRNEWSWGDGTTGSGLSVMHSYAASGTYEVTFTVFGSSSSATDECVVTVVGPADVAGIYDFTEFRFNPDPQFVPDAVVLDTLNTERTSVELLDSGQFQFRYRFLDGLDNIINGTFTISSGEIVLNFEPGNETRLRSLLLDPSLRFSQAGADLLTLSTSKRVNLEAYSAIYRDTGLDLTDVPGLLEIELQRRGR